MSSDTIFTKIIKRQIPREILYEDDLCFVIRDIKPQAPVHILIIPKEPIEGLSDTTTEKHTQLLGHLLNVARNMAKKEKVENNYRVGNISVLTITNNHPHYARQIPHLHFHLLGGRKMEWPPG